MAASRNIEARLILSGEDKGATATIEKVVKAARQMEDAAKVSAKMEGLARALQQVEQASKVTEAAMKARAGFAAAEAGLKATQGTAAAAAKALTDAKVAKAAFDGVKAAAGTEQARQIEATAKAVREASTAYRKAEGDVRKANAAVAAQTATLQSADAAASKFGADLGNLERHQAGLAQKTDLATRALRAQIAAEDMGAKATVARAQRSAHRREAVGTIAAGAGVIAAHKGKEIGLAAIQSVASFDIAVRKQKEFTDISDADQARLLKQAKKIGQETQFSNEDVVKAQTASMQGLPANFAPDLKAAVAEGIVDNVKNYATLMETDLKEGSEVIRSYLQMTGKDISTKQKALTEANKATNQLVKMAKLGGMNGEDVGLFVKGAMSSGTTAGLTTDSLMSLAALAKRGGLRGDEAGTFVKTSAGKLVSPTKKGLAAYNAMGVTHSGFVKMPDQLSTSALEGQFRLDLGKGFTPAIRQRLDAINADKSLTGDQGRYTEAVTKAVEGILGKKKNGEVQASDRQVAAKAVGNFYKVAAQSVDVEGLLDAVMKANPTLAQLNAIFTGAHGGKGAITQRQWDEFKASREEIKKAGDDPDFAAKKARNVMAGVGGSIENMKGSFENFTLAVGEANKGLIKFTADSLGNLVDKFSELPKEQQQALSLGAGAVGLGGGALATYKLTKNLLGFGPAGALNGSAAALTKSAVALELAAAKLAGGLPGGAVPEGAKKGSKIGSIVKGAFGLLGVGALATAANEMNVLPAPDVEKEGLGRSALNFLDPNLGDMVLGKRTKSEEEMETDRELSRARAMIHRDGAGAGLPSRAVPKMIDGEAAERAAKDVGEKAGEAYGKGVVSVPLPPARPDLFKPITDKAAEAGTQAGQSLSDGVKAKAPEVEEQGKTLFQRLKDVFAQGIVIPMSFGAGEGGAGGSGGSLIQRASFGGGGSGLNGGGGAGPGGGGPPPGSGGSGRITAPLGGAPTEGLRGQVRAYVRAAAISRGIDPNVAERVVNQESGFNPHRNNLTAKEKSYGVMQLNTQGGLGAVALGKGINPRDPNAWRNHIDFGLDVVKRDGWRQWYGARDVGISRWQGIGKGGQQTGRSAPEAPAGSLGGNRAGYDAAAEKILAAAEKMENAGFHGRVDVALSGGGGRVTGIRAKGKGMSADMGVSMPGAKESDDDWA